MGREREREEREERLSPPGFRYPEGISPAGARRSDAHACHARRGRALRVQAARAVIKILRS